MTIWQGTKNALGLLSMRDRRRVTLLVLAQASLAFLDLLGVLAFGVVAALTTSLISGQAVPAVSQVIDRIGLGDREFYDLALWIAIGAGLTLICKTVISFLLMRRTLGFLAARQSIISGNLFRLLLAAPIEKVLQRSSQSNAYALIYGVTAATLGVLGSAVVVVVEGFLIVVLIAGLFVINPAVTLAAFLYFSFVGITLHRILSGWAGRLGFLQRETDTASLVMINSTIQSFREVSVSGRQPFVVEKFQALRWRSAHNAANVVISQQVSKYVFEIALVIGAGLLAWTQFATQSSVSAATTISIFLIAASRLTPSFLRLQQSLFGIRTAAGAAQSTFAIDQDLSEVTSSDHNDLTYAADWRRIIQEEPLNHYKSFSNELTLRDVSFRYAGANRYTIQDFSVTVPSASSLAIAGPSGAGKSTLADIILGIVTPSSGSISIGALSPKEVVSQHPGAMAYVPQNVAVIDGSIRANVALGMPRDLVDDEWVWSALEKARLADFLKQEGKSLDMEVGEYGARLSGGQSQRLGVARALYSRPRLVVLDEATSALDAETEYAISDTLASLSGQTTLIVIAHRLATLRSFDQIAYFESGILKGLGGFDNVRKQAPRFDRQANLLGL